MRRAFIFVVLLLAALPARAQRTASNPLGAQLNVQDAGTCSTTNSFAWQVLPANAATTIVNLSGTFSGTLTIRLSTNGGGSWTTNSTTTTAGNTSVATNGFTDICADVTTFTSGIFQVSISTGLNTGPQGPAGTPGGSAPPNSPLPAATSGPGPVFNVKNYGAKGDSQATGTNACSSVASTTITCSGTAFSSTTDVGKNWFCSNGTSDFYASLTKIVTVNNAGSITTDAASIFNGFSCTGVWGTLDDTAVSTAATAAIAASKGVNQVGNKGILSAAPHLYFPSGGYLLCTAMASGVVTLGSTISGFVMEGDGPDNSFLYSGAANSGVICAASTSGAFVQVGSGAGNVLIKNLTFDGAHQFNGNNSAALSISGSAHLSEVYVQRWAGNGTVALTASGSNFYADHVVTVTNDGPGFQCIGCSGVWESGGSSNNGNNANLIISGVFGSNAGPGFRVGKGVLIDECGNNSVGCTQVINSNDVWFMGPALFGTSGGFCVNVDPNSFLHWVGGICGTFGNDTNAGGPKIQAGGTLEESDVRNIGSGSGKCITNSGVFLDNGNNTCENMYPITSSASSGTTATLTVSNPSSVAPTTNCTVGDSLLVEGNTVPGYNGYFSAGITAVTATTIAYLTQGSNIGAGAGGSVTCRNLQSYSGTLPKALLNNPIPNTCYITGTFAATTAAAPMCAFKLGSATNINFIKAASTTTTACTVAPIVTISDGTVSETLTITTAKSIWDSSVDTSTGVGTSIFKPNGTITLSNTVGTCTTPPTNFSVSYNITPILSN